VTATDDGAEDDTRVVWRMLHVKDEAGAFAVYGDVFGWTPIDTRLANGRREQAFAWDAGGIAAGSIANTASLPGVHAHWMFFFATNALDDALTRVHEAGGLTLPVIERADGSRVAPCEDPQRAAFGLYQGSHS
jgi:predicted enzyme related to lactoylglutathione lyase